MHNETNTERVVRGTASPIKSSRPKRVSAESIAVRKTSPRTIPKINSDGNSISFISLLTELRDFQHTEGCWLVRWHLMFIVGHPGERYLDLQKLLKAHAGSRKNLRMHRKLSHLFTLMSLLCFPPDIQQDLRNSSA